MLNEPELVQTLHREFIGSGARVITLNTYTATPQRLARENELANLIPLHNSAMHAAKQAIALSARSDVLIAGCLPPLVASYRPDASLSFEHSLDTYRQLVELQSPASDLFICETMSSICEARAACTAALESGKPVWLSLSVCDDQSGRLRSSESLDDALQVLAPLGAQAILLNCSQPESIDACWPLLSKSSSSSNQRFGAYGNGFVSVESLYPGDTVEELQVRKDMSPKQYAEHAMGWVEAGASIIGGCCEIGPEHIKALYERLINAGYSV
jgi:S-methylmethionine-dependent homocysteine/selenocysteine methylase